jgi:hypothetical protein
VSRTLVTINEWDVKEEEDSYCIYLFFATGSAIVRANRRQVK